MRDRSVAATLDRMGTDCSGTDGAGTDGSGTDGAGHGRARSSRRPPGEPSSGGVAWRQYAKSGVLLLVAAVSLYVLLPTLVSVFGSWRSLSHLDWYFAVLVLACEAASYVCLWELDRIALGTNARFPIACAQLAGTAVGRFVPGAPTPFAVEMLRRAGVDAGQAAAALTASTGLQLATMRHCRCWRCRRSSAARR